MNDPARPADRPTRNERGSETIRTETLPEGTLFVSPDGVLYQVVMAGSAGFRKAEPWPWLPYGWSGDTERPNAVALVPGSLLARNYPVVAEGKPLPVISQSDLLNPDGQTSHYVFPGEQLAKLAAQLDKTLVHQSSLAVRKERRRWTISDGRQILRVYHYQSDDQEANIDLTARFTEGCIMALSCIQGPTYWQHLPAWKETLDAQAMTPAPTLEPVPDVAVAETVASQTVEDEETETPLVTEAPSEPKVEAMEHATTPVAPSASKTRRSPTMILSIDIGYGYTKGVGPDGMHFSFPSVIGTAEDIRFATDLIRGGEERPVKYGDWRFFYGEQAVLQSRIQSAIFDRSRVHDSTYKMLFVAALVEMTKRLSDARRVNVTTGLPVDFFADQPDVIQSFEGTYRITTEQQIEITVESVVVTPQPFGSLFRELLNENGKIVSSDVEKGRVGIIDVGTYTTDYVVSDGLRYVQRLSGSIRIGWSKVISQVQQALGDMYMLELTPHEVDRAVQERKVRVRGESISLEPFIEPAITDIMTAIIARARDLWGAGTSLDTILVSGGGGPHLYDTIHDVYPHALLLDNAFWANAEGLYRFGQRPATFEK
ncbi:MAG: ParM/StbA family protein [Chloroflexota bacterium]|nr:ParM/StbA family protein [Chloroflexota bacterium]